MIAATLVLLARQDIRPDAVRHVEGYPAVGGQDRRTEQIVAEHILPIKSKAGGIGGVV